MDGDSGPEPTVAGNPELQEKFPTPIKDHKHIFSEELRLDPALINT